MRSRLIRSVVLLVLVLAACSRETSIRESDEARVPDDIGIATDVTLGRIQLDGERTYEMHEQVESFATRSHRVTALLSWEKKYVHVGVEDDKARWIAGIGIPIGDDPPLVTYSGVFESFDEESRRVTFEDGTVLEFADDVEVPDEEGREIVVQIDTERDRVTRITP